MPIIKKINLYSSSDLKANLDENLFSVFESLGYAEDFTLIDVRLGLGILSALVAGATFYIDKKSEFKDSINIVTALIAIYFTLGAALWYWGRYVEKAVKFVGHKDKDKLMVSTSTEKTNPRYRVLLSLNGKESIEVEVAYNEMYNENGFLEYLEFKSFLQKELAKISKKSL